MTEILREIIPLTNNDCFTVFSREKKHFDFPLHYHEEFELNFIMNAKGAQRIIGDHIHTIDQLELVFVGPNLPHGWFTHQCKSKKIKEITIQFHRHLFEESFLQRNQLSFIRNMFRQSAKGILFSQEAIRMIMPRLIELPSRHGFDSVLELMSILHDLSISRNIKTLSDESFTNMEVFSSSRRIEKVLAYLHENYDKNVTLREAAKIASMTEIGFSRFFKQKTGKTFIDTLNEIRLGHASRILIETTHNIKEVAYKCGFNNMSNFNRFFRKKKGCTPKEFRDTYNTSGVRAFI